MKEYIEVGITLIGDKDYQKFYEKKKKLKNTKNQKLTKTNNKKLLLLLLFTPNGTKAFSHQ